MVNRSNRGYDLPRLRLDEQVSGEIYQPNHSADVSPGFAMIAKAAQGIGERLGEMADRAALQEGQTQAAADAKAGRLTPQTEMSIRGRAYNAIARDTLGAQRRGALKEGMDKAYLEHDRNPAELGTAFDAIWQAQSSTGFADLDAKLQGDYQLLRSDYMSKSAVVVKQAQEKQGQANFLETFNRNQATLDQVASGATFDEAGAVRVTTAYSTFLNDLVKYGPKEPFEVGGQQFAADDSRLGVISPDDLAKTGIAAQQQARLTWILGAGRTLNTSTEKEAFAADVRKRWQAGDPMFAGLDGAAMDTALKRLETDADRAEMDERAERAEAGRQAGNMIEALVYGADVDLAELRRYAAASGDPGLVAKADIYGRVATENPGLLRQHAEDQIMGPENANAWYGAPGDGNKPRGIRNRNPGNVKALEKGRWAGQVGVDADGFAVFGSMAEGDAAARKNLQAYGRQGYDTVAEIVYRWAPPKDHNDTEAYVTAVMQRTGFGRNQKLDLNDPQTLDRLTAAMYRQENGPAWRAMSSGAPEAFQNDPIGYARGTSNRPPLASVPALALDDVFSEDGQAVDGWAASLRRRQALGGELGKTSGRETRMLDNSERTYYKQIIDEDPVKAVRLAVTARRALGEDGAAAFIREIGGKGDNSSMALHLSDLAAGGSPIFASVAAEGLALKAGGRSLPDAEKRVLTATMDKYAPSLRQVPAVYAPALRTAEAAMIRDQARGIEREADYYVQSALGGTATNGHGYGGVVKLNGALTVLPRWLNDQQGDDALRALADYWGPRNLGPVYSNGKPMPADKVARMRMVLLPNGWYRLVSPETGKPVMRGDGKPFDVEIEATRGFLLRKLGPAAVRGSQ